MLQKVDELLLLCIACTKAKFVRGKAVFTLIQDIFESLSADECKEWFEFIEKNVEALGKVCVFLTFILNFANHATDSYGTTRSECSCRASHDWINETALKNRRYRILWTNLNGIVTHHSPIRSIRSKSEGSCQQIEHHDFYPRWIHQDSWVRFHSDALIYAMFEFNVCQQGQNGRW